MSPHRVSLHLSVRLPRLPLKGGVDSCSSRWHALPFLAPLSRGGRGGCLSRREASGGRIHPRISPHLALPGLRPREAGSGARTGGVPMDLGRMDLERRKRTDPAARVRPATDPVLPARWEFPKNTINTDKFTMFFDKFLKFNTPTSYCNLKNYHVNMSVAHSDSAAKKVFRLPRICPQLPAFPPTPHHAG